MKNLYHRLLLVIAAAIQEELATYIRYLKTEDRGMRDELRKCATVTRMSETSSSSVVRSLAERWTSC